MLHLLTCLVRRDASMPRLDTALLEKGNTGVRCILNILLRRQANSDPAPAGRSSVTSSARHFLTTIALSTTNRIPNPAENGSHAHKISKLRSSGQNGARFQQKFTCRRRKRTASRTASQGASGPLTSTRTCHCGQNTVKGRRVQKAT